MLIKEYLNVCDKIDNGLLAEKNEVQILNELICKLEADKEARQLIGEDLYKVFKTNYQSYGKRELRQFIELFDASLDGKDYLNLIKQHLISEVKDNKKQEINRLLLQFVCEVKNVGYASRFIYKCLNRYLINPISIGCDAFEDFINEFSGEESEYRLIIEEQKELAEYCLAFSEDLKFKRIPFEDLPEEIEKVDRIKAYIKVEQIEALDEYVAVAKAKTIIKAVEHFYLFYRHELHVTDAKCYVFTNNKYVYIEPEAKGIQKSIKGIKQQSLVNDAKVMFEFAINKPDNFYDLMRIMDIHNTAVCMDSAANALLSMWSIFEILLEKETSKASGSRITQITKMMEPFLKCHYIRGLVNQFKEDFERFDNKKMKEVLANISEGTSSTEKMYALIILNKYDVLRDELYKQWNEYPLLRNRLFILNEELSTNRSTKRLIENHVKKTTWQLYRIYRARNCIIHDGESIQNIEDLVENLHNYIDELCKGIIENASKRSAAFSVADVIYEMKIKNKLYDKRLEAEQISEENFCTFLNF